MVRHTFPNISFKSLFGRSEKQSVSFYCEKTGKSINKNDKISSLLHSKICKCG